MEKIKDFLISLDGKNITYYYVGDQCVNKLNNNFHTENKIETNNYDLILLCTIKEFNSLFKDFIQNDSTFCIRLEDGSINIVLCNDQDDLNNFINNSKFTLNAILRDKDNNYIDYKYTYRNKKISSIDDIKNKKIRIVGNVKQQLKDDPSLIIESFYLMAKYNYEIEQKTLLSIKENLDLLLSIDEKIINNLINKLLINKHVSRAIDEMNKNEIFDINIKVFNFIKSISKERKIFELVDRYNTNLSIKSKPSILEIWTIICLFINKDEIYNNLITIGYFSEKDISKIEWLINNWNILNEDENNYRLALYNSRNGIVKEYGLMCLRELVIRMCKIYNTFDPDKYRKKTDKLQKDLCSRPYFVNQLHITDKQLVDISGENNDEIINKIKDRLIYKFVIADMFPQTMEDYLELVNISIEETIFEDMMV